MHPRFPLRLAFLLVGMTAMLPGRPHAARPTSPTLVLERTIPLPDVSGRIDHMAIDLRRGHLFVAELGNGSVDVVDLADGKAVQRIAGLNEPQGVGYAPRADRIAVASAGDGSVRLFQGETLQPAGLIALGRDADNVRLDPRTGRFIVGYGSGGLAVIDPPSRSVVARVTLPAHPEGFQLSLSARKVFVNVPDARQIAVVDFATGKQVASWRVAGLAANFPMALDAGAGVLATVFRDPPRLVVLDTGDGAVRASLASCGDADDVFLDGRRHRIYVSCGTGAIDIVQEGAAGFHALGSVRTRRGARTSLFVPELDRLFVAVPAGARRSGAEILVFRPEN